MIAEPFEFDRAKNESNRAKHGVGLDEFRGFDADPIVVEDARRDYGEQRFRAFGRIGGVPYMLAFSPRGGGSRLITFRRAHDREIRRYER